MKLSLQVKCSINPVAQIWCWEDAQSSENKRSVEKQVQKVGKTNLPDPLVTITLHAKSVDHSEVFHELLGHTLSESEYFPRIFHIDIAHEVMIIIYFENIHFFHAQLGLDVSPDMNSLHVSLNTGHSCHQLHF